MTIHAQNMLAVLREGAYAPLYHGTSYIQLFNIYSSNTLRAGWINKKMTGGGLARVSVSRNIYAARVHGEVIFVLDAEKLRHKFRIVPYEGMSAQVPKSARPRPDDYEAEEVVLGVIHPLRKYLISIIVNQDRLLELAQAWGPDYKEMAKRILADPIVNSRIPRFV